MSYVTSSNLSRDAIYQKPKGRPAKKKEKHSDELVIKKFYSDSPDLSLEEQKLIDEICAEPGVFYRKRLVQHTEISGGGKWGLIWEDKEHYEQWCYQNRLDNRNYNGGELDYLFAIFGHGDDY